MTGLCGDCERNLTQVSDADLTGLKARVESEQERRKRDREEPLPEAPSDGPAAPPRRRATAILGEKVLRTGVRGAKAGGRLALKGAKNAYARHKAKKERGGEEDGKSPSPEAVPSPPPSRSRSRSRSRDEIAPTPRPATDEEAE